MQDLIVAGRNPVKGVLFYKPKEILKLYVLTDKPDKRGREILDLAKNNHVDIIYNKSKDFDLSRNVHQGFILILKQRKYASLKDLVEKKRLLILDQIYDPHNFGAILRSAECFGVEGVIWSESKSASLTPIAIKSSAGASEFINLCPVKNINSAIDFLKKNGFWFIAADGSSESQSLESFDCPDRFALILGTEGSGISELTLKKSDYKIKIPMSGRIDSLNVSQAAAVFLSKLTIKS